MKEIPKNQKYYYDVEINKAKFNEAALKSTKVVLADSPPHVEIDVQRQLIEHRNTSSDARC